MLKQNGPYGGINAVAAWSDSMVAGICVEETQRIVPCGSVDNLIDAREGEGILWASLIKVLEVDA